MEIFKLFGSIFIDNEKANQSIAKTEKQAESLTAKLSNGIKTATKWGSAIYAGAGAAGAAILGVANKSAEAADRIDKMSQKLGFTRQAFQEWDFILSQNGASIDSLGAGMKTLTNQVDELAKGGKVATDAFAELGLSYEDLAGKSQEEIFEMTIVALQNMEDETKRAAIANDLLGRSGQELAPLLNAGADSVENLKNKANELGIIMSDDAVDAGVVFTDTMDQAKRVLGIFGAELGLSIMPVMQRFLEWVLTNMPIIKEIASTVFNTISTITFKLFEIFNDYILPILATFYSWIKENFPIIKETGIDVFNSIWEVIKRLWAIIEEDLYPIFQILYSWIEPHFPKIKSIISGAFDAVIDIAKTLIDVFETIVETVKKVLEWIDKFNKKKVEKKSFSIPGVTSTSVKSYSSLQGLASGTDEVTKAGVFRVGERGPEEVFLPKGAAVKPYTGDKPSITINISNPNILDDYGVDRLMDRIIERMGVLGVR